jgi:hypothetical protein
MLNQPEVNTTPIADAGSNTTGLVDEEIQLDGSGSSDPDGDSLSYSWTITDAPSGSSATLSDSTIVDPILIPDVEGTYSITLTVNDGNDSDSAAIQLTVSSILTTVTDGRVLFVGDDSPFGGEFANGTQPLMGNILSHGVSTSLPANILIDSNLQGHQDLTDMQSYLEDSSYTIHTSDPSSWTTEVLSNHCVVLLDSANGDLESYLAYLNGGGFIIVQSGGVDLLGAVFGISVQGSHEDPDPLWDLTLTSFAEHPLTRNLVSLQCLGPYDFSVEEPDELTTLSTQDGLDWLAIWEANEIHFTNQRPVAAAGNDASVYTDTAFQLDGSSSYDDDGDGLSYQWNVTQAPQSSAAQIVGADQVDPTFTPDEAGTYILSLVVNDGAENSDPDTVVLTVTHAPPLELIDVESLDGYSFRLTFNNDLDGPLAETPSNYTVRYWEWDMTVDSAILEASGRSVVITTLESQNPGVSYSVNVQNLEDLYGNVISAGTMESLGQAPVHTANWGHADNLTLSGRITYEDGTPAAGVTYRIHHRGPDGFYDPANQDDIMLSVVSDSNGDFILQGLADQSAYADYYDQAWFDTYWDTPVGYERLTQWPSLPAGVSSITLNFTLYEIQPSTVLEGYILDNYDNPIEISSEVSWISGVSLWRGDVLINEGGFDLSNPDPNADYYYDQSTGYYRITGIAGGEYTLNGILTDGYTPLPDTTVTVTPGGTTQQDFVTYKTTANDKLAIQMTAPADGATLTSPTAFDWDFTNHSVAQCYTLGIWSSGNVLNNDGTITGAGTADMLLIGMPVSTNSVSVTFGSADNTVSGTDYRVYGDINLPLTSGETYYWGIFSYDGQYQELNYVGDTNGEPSEGLRSFTAP